MELTGWDCGAGQLWSEPDHQLKYVQCILFKVIFLFTKSWCHSILSIQYYHWRHPMVYFRGVWFRHSTVPEQCVDHLQPELYAMWRRDLHSSERECGMHSVPWRHMGHEHRWNCKKHCLSFWMSSRLMGSIDW